MMSSWWVMELWSCISPVWHVHWLDMVTSSNGNIFRVTGHMCGEFTGPGEFPAQRPVTRSFDVFSDLRLNTPLSKQSWGWWFETPSRPLWRHCNEWNYRLGNKMNEQSTGLGSRTACPRTSNWINHNYVRSIPTAQHRVNEWLRLMACFRHTLIARFMGPTWGPSGADGTQVGPMLAPWTLLSGYRSM